MKPADYLPIRDMLGKLSLLTEIADRDPVSVFGMDANQVRAEEMAEYCEENGFAATVVRTPTVLFLEFYDERHAVLFKFRWV